mmetsp:Transcript_22780/g.37744  ORF Transcript_22780/g.37744 Transcript_22780/m.37744 type:complete len:532 (+) Transcript_22780:128-1723(+)
MQLTHDELLRSISHLGDLRRLQCFLSRASAGANLSIGVVGGSVSAGSSSWVRRNQSALFHKRLQRWLEERFPHSHFKHFNGAIPAVPPKYLEHCLPLHVPPTADLILLESAANLCGKVHAKKKCADGLVSVERILRRLMAYPRQPAVVFVHVSPFWTMQTERVWPGTLGSKLSRRWLASEDLNFDFHSQWGHPNHEHMLDELSKYYGLPSVSLRDVVYHAAKANSTFHGYTLPQLYYDRIHPSNHGHEVLSRSLEFLLERVIHLANAGHDHLKASSRACDTQQLLPVNAMLPTSNNPQGALQCLDATAIGESLVDRSDCSWELKVELSSFGVPKPGWVASQVGQSCRFHYAARTDWLTHSIGLGYLKSYEGLGSARVECEGSCSCNASMIDAHWTERTSPNDIHYFDIRLSDERTRARSGALPERFKSHAVERRCAFRLTIVNESSSGQHKFKLTALFLNEYGSEQHFGRWILNHALQLHAADVVAQRLDSNTSMDDILSVRHHASKQPVLPVPAMRRAMVRHRRVMKKHS